MDPVCSPEICNWLQGAEKVLVHISCLCPSCSGRCDDSNVTSLLSYALCFFGRIDAGCIGKAATFITVTDVRVDEVASPVLQQPQFLGRCLVKVVLPFWYGLCFHDQIDLGVVLPLCLKLWFAGRTTACSRKSCVEVPMTYNEFSVASLRDRGMEVRWVGS